MWSVEHGVGSLLTILEVLIQSQPCSSTFALLKRAMVTLGSPMVWDPSLHGTRVLFYKAIVPEPEVS